MSKIILSDKQIVIAKETITEEATWGRVQGALEDQIDLMENLNQKINSDEKGKPNGVATLGADGKVPLNQLPPMGEGGSGGINVIDYDPKLHEVAVAMDPNDVAVVSDKYTWNAAASLLQVTAELDQANAWYGYSNIQGTVNYAATKMSFKNGTYGEITADLSQVTQQSVMLVWLPVGESLEDFIYQKIWNMSAFGRANCIVAEFRKFYSATKLAVDSKQNISEATIQTYENDGSSGWGVVLQDAYTAYMEMSVTQEMWDSLPQIEKDRILASNVMYPISQDVSSAVMVKKSDYELYFIISDSMLDEAAPPTATPETMPFDLPISVKVEIGGMGQRVNSLPENINTGDYLHVLDTANINNKYINKGTFLLMYDNATKFIQLKQ